MTCTEAFVPISPAQRRVDKVDSPFAPSFSVAHYRPTAHLHLFSLILRHAARRRPVLPSMSLPIPTMHHDRRLPASTLHLLLHIRSVLDILPEIADVAANFLIRLERERDDGDEAEGEPFPKCVRKAKLQTGEGSVLKGPGRTSASSHGRKSCRSSGIVQ